MVLLGNKRDARVGRKATPLQMLLCGCTVAWTVLRQNGSCLGFIYLGQSDAVGWASIGTTMPDRVARLREWGHEFLLSWEGI